MKNKKKYLEGKNFGFIYTDSIIMDHLMMISCPADHVISYIEISGKIRISVLFPYAIWLPFLLKHMPDQTGILFLPCKTTLMILEWIT